MFPTFSAVTRVVGILTILGCLVKIFNLLALYLRPSGLGRFIHKSRNGDRPWAMVTGATSGIGLAFAHELASHGFNVVIHGRNHDKLSRVLSQLQAAFPMQSFKSVIANAATMTRTADQSISSGKFEMVDFKAIQESLSSINLTVLINNAGGGHCGSPTDPTCQPLRESSEDRIVGDFSLNGLFPLLLTRALLPDLMRNSPSLVMNISSVADKGLPLLTTYGASKSFIMTATRSLRLEMQMEKDAQKDVEILGIRIGKVTEAGGHKEAANLLLPSAQTMAKAALARAGHDNGVVVGYWGHALQLLITQIIGLLPRSVEDNVLVKIMDQQREYYDHLKQS
ncbi:hypothetical protein PFICI_01699 [Pestalotiopsis fici W106-1]|uniref:Uncharacterized protein n=1 Tax=Pestalotiopsis fici (strain W106-1 / CGMCC3.15140) TaxID=1229662 RepID=W3XRM4_PESFW|nr:uncharacterized protein PFICI_01699 [Pestalotiopsis fici W106-1]ETS87871.1 hypothetical protein PFICI_01699 [Pestalotiopsis fici W106-1]